MLTHTILRDFLEKLPLFELLSVLSFTTGFYSVRNKVVPKFRNKTRVVAQYSGLKHLKNIYFKSSWFILSFLFFLCSCYFCVLVILVFLSFCILFILVFFLFLWFCNSYALLFLYFCYSCILEFLCTCYFCILFNLAFFLFLCSCHSCALFSCS